MFLDPHSAVPGSAVSMGQTFLDEGVPSYQGDETAMPPAELSEPVVVASEPEPEAQGMSTRAKWILGFAIAGGLLLGYKLWKDGS